MFSFTELLWFFFFQVEGRLVEEKERCEKYLNESTQDQLVKTLERVLISKRLELFQNEFGNLLEANKVSELAGISVEVFFLYYFLL